MDCEFDEIKFTIKSQTARDAEMLHRPAAQSVEVGRRGAQANAQLSVRTQEQIEFKKRIAPLDGGFWFR